MSRKRAVPADLDSRPRHGCFQQVEHAIVFHLAHVVKRALLLGIQALQRHGARAFLNS